MMYRSPSPPSPFHPTHKPRFQEFGIVITRDNKTTVHDIVQRGY
ncbi:hypothetical protein AZE42_10439 [Rhizopogon vesiculosus]|uniref:Uncharacterized protein n=1 Tax=Rhizopogon vesiculosus TaxID=180088 RepID=A0A1J8PIJ0_9AGAM|nr:hypothetical protein AZE42_10439 [Rhizopogon vesiculosus]